MFLPDGAWHKDADGNLISDTGDNANTLADFLHISQGTVSDIISKEGFLNNYNTSDLELLGEQSIHLSNYNLIGNNYATRIVNLNFMNIFTPMHAQSQQDWKPFLGAVAAAMAAPLILPSIGLTSSKAIVVNVLRDSTAELYGAGGDINRVNFASVFASGLTGCWWRSASL